MRVAVVNLTRGSISGGYRKYLKRVVPLLRADPRVTDVAVYCQRDAARTLSDCFTPILPSHALWTPRSLAQAARKFRSDVVFIPTGWWIKTGLPTVVMVRNMEPMLGFVKANGVYANLENAARYMLVRRAVRRADGVVAVSDHVQSTLLERFGASTDKIRRIYHGVDVDGAEPAEARSGKPFLLTAGSIRPARGLEDVLKAYALIAQPLRPRLLIAGASGSGMRTYEEKLRRLAVRLDVSDSVCWLGQVKAEEVTRLMRAAHAFVMTSRAEACPNTLLEAMSVGCVIVSTTSEPMPEFVGDAGIYYEAGNAAHLAEILGTVISTPATAYADLRRRAINSASGYTWANTADETIGFLMAVARGERQPA
jgi:glycosyltransferase involved in cell wall biosynthesis